MTFKATQDHQNFLY